MLFSSGPGFNLRILISVRHTVHIFLLAQLCCRDMAMVRRTYTKTKLNSVALVRERTIPTERPPPVGEVSANFCRGQKKREIIITSVYFTPTTIKPPCEKGCSSSFDVMLMPKHETACTLEHHAHTHTHTHTYNVLSNDKAKLVPTEVY